MAGLPQALPRIRTQPPRAAPPSTISNTSSTSSNATVVPQVTTPRARSPNSKYIPLPDPSSNGTSWSIQMDNDPGHASMRKTGARHPHWEAPAMMVQDIALLDEKTIFHGLRWRLEQFLDVKPPYGLITPEIVEAARADMNICGPAIDLLASAVLADGDPPVCELPFVRADESGVQHANYTVPLTIKNSPEPLQKHLESWAATVQQLRQLDPQFHTEVARNICDLDPLMNVLSPQVARIAADLKKLAEEMSFRRIFLDRFSEAVIQRLREEGSTLSMLPPARVLPLPSVQEDRESDSSSNGSRPSSRSSRRSRSGSKQQHSRRRAPGVGDTSGLQMPYSNGSRSRSSSTSSLRLDDNGNPLEDGSEIRYEDDVSTSHLHVLAGGNHVGRSPRERPRHINGASQLYERGPSPANSRPVIYSGILPLTIPAFSGEEPISDISSDQNRRRTPQPSTQPTSSPNSSKPEMLATHRMELPSPVEGSSYGHRLPVVPPQPPRARSPNGWSTEAVTSAVPKSRGPRPLPPRPSRSPKPELAQSSSAPPPPAPAPAPAPTQPVQLNFSWTVPDQGGSSNYAMEPTPYQIPSHGSAVFVVPSSIPSQAEVSFSSHGLDAARQRYAMESTSSLHSVESDYKATNLADAGGSGAHAKNGQSNMAMNTANSASGSHYRHPGNDQNRATDLRHTNSANPLIPTWAATPETFRAAANSSSHHTTGINGPASNWVSPSSWRGPPSETNPAPKESGGLLSGVKSWVTGSSSKGSRNAEPGHATSTSGSSRGSESQYAASSSPGASRRSPPRNLGDATTHAATPFTPDSATAYYFGGQTSSSRPSSANSQPQSFSMNGYVVPSSQHRSPVGGHSNLSQSIPPVGEKPISPGFAETYQVNPVAASIYYGAGPSGTRHVLPAHQFPPDVKALPPPPPQPSSADLSLTPEVEAIRETMYGAIMEALASHALRHVMAKDSQRAFFSAMSLANLNVSMTLQPGTNDSPNLVVMMGREIRLTDLPGAYRTCLTELAAIGREAKKLSEEDDERAIAYVARGKSLPEPRIGRVRKLLERGVGFIGVDGRVRGAKESSGNGTGRSREFSNKISALTIEMMKLPAFQEEKLREVVG